MVINSRLKKIRCALPRIDQIYTNVNGHLYNNVMRSARAVWTRQYDISDLPISPDENGVIEIPDCDLNLSDVIATIGITDGIPALHDVNAMSWPWYVEITEQPAPKGLRFRYECEGRSAGSLLGVSSTQDNKTYPTIKIHGYVGQAVIIATCITKEGLLVHPHNLVGKNCNHGVHTYRMKVAEGAREHSFKNLGIQCVKKKDIPAALANRESRRIDPFQKGFAHANDASKIDLNAVRLAIQVIVKDGEGRDHSLHPVFTDIIYDKKSSSDLLIMRVSHCSGLASGGTKIILLTEKVNRDDIVVAFYEEVDGVEVWCREVAPLLIHRQFAVVVDTPPYRDPYTQAHVSVSLQLRRKSDGKRSNCSPFEYIPADLFKLRRKTPKPSTVAMYDTESAESKPVVKLEPRVTSPHMQAFQFGEQSPAAQRWEAGGVQAFGQELPWQYAPRPLHQLSPSPSLGHQLSPSPSMGHQLSPSPSMGHQLSPSPSMGHQLSPSPSMGHQLSPSPGLGSMSQHSPHPNPTMSQLSPHHGQNVGQISLHPGQMGQMTPHSPAMGQVSPHPGQRMSHMGVGQEVQMSTSPGYMQQHQQQYQMVSPPMEQNPSLSEIFNEQLLNDLQAMDGASLSESLFRLSTSGMSPN